MMFKRPDTPAILIVIAFSFGSFCFASYAFYQLNEIVKWQQSRAGVPNEIKEIKKSVIDLNNLKKEIMPLRKYDEWQEQFFKLNPELKRPDIIMPASRG